jgi:hypothetical protein
VPKIFLKLRVAARLSKLPVGPKRLSPATKYDSLAAQAPSRAGVSPVVWAIRHKVRNDESCLDRVEGKIAILLLGGWVIRARYPERLPRAGRLWGLSRPKRGIGFDGEVEG